MVLWSLPFHDGLHHHRLRGVGYDLPWWGFLVTQLIPFVFTLPIGMVAAVTNVGIGLFLEQTLLTGRIECDHRVYCRVHVPWETTGKYDDQDIWIHDCVTGTTLSSEILTYQGLDFVADLKLGLYMKVSPKSMFRTQILATGLS